MAVRYRNLLSHLQQLSQEQLEDNASIYIPSQDEYFEIEHIDNATPKNTDVLDPGHLFLVLKEW